MRFHTWNVRSVYRVGSLMAVEEELSECKLYLVRVQERRWNRGLRIGRECIFFYGKRNVNHE
jgi:hypothetical protein